MSFTTVMVTINKEIYYSFYLTLTDCVLGTMFVGLREWSKEMIYVKHKQV